MKDRRGPDPEGPGVGTIWGVGWTQGTRALTATLVGAVLLACAPVVLASPECTPLHTDLVLPSALAETSGVTFGTRDPGILWTHNDGSSRLFALDTLGGSLGSLPVGMRTRDWEDIAAGRCARHGHCLYVADTGDNQEARSPGDIRILRIAEPSVPLGADIGDVEVFPIRLPNGARDVEALFVLPGERLQLVTKGRNHPIAVYAYPPPLRPDTVTLIEVQTLTRGAQPVTNQVTGAGADPEGTRVALRTYQSMAFYRMEADTLRPVSGGFVNLRSLRESQGEGIGLGPDGRVALTSEAGPFGGPPLLSLLRCSI